MYYKLDTNEFIYKIFPPTQTNANKSSKKSKLKKTHKSSHGICLSDSQCSIGNRNTYHSYLMMFEKAFLNNCQNTNVKLNQTTKKEK